MGVRVCFGGVGHLRAWEHGRKNWWQRAGGMVMFMKREMNKGVIGADLRSVMQNLNPSCHSIRILESVS